MYVYSNAYFVMTKLPDALALLIYSDYRMPDVKPIGQSRCTKCLKFGFYRPWIFIGCVMAQDRSCQTNKVHPKYYNLQLEKLWYAAKRGFCTILFNYTYTTFFSSICCLFSSCCLRIKNKKVERIILRMHCKILFKTNNSAVIFKLILKIKFQI